MDNKKWNLYIGMGVLLTSFAMILFAGSLIRPGNLGAYVLQTQNRLEIPIDATLKEAVEATYDVSFAFPRRGTENVSLYIPEYDYIEFEQAELYLNTFDIGALIRGGEEDDGGAFHIFKGEKGELHVNKYYNRIIARFIGPFYGDSANPLDQESVLHAALEYIIGTSLPFDYAVSTAARQDGGWSVSFYREIGGLICRDHPVSITLDAYGNILGVDYYLLSYEKIAQASLITTREAYYSLPPLCVDSKVDLKKCALVYKFEDSILQPVYLFEGEIVQAGEVKPFSYYINAAKFN
ncbi:MAG: hypothetical protein FWE91_02140 [Defluviitaleaceae bacterium]|nr:hypothetical protein [Defluviitaleaceae bacterium]MCL2835107.1 hypothetical protein [Defluviitaleaceae bacterium]